MNADNRPFHSLKALRVGRNGDSRAAAAPCVGIGRSRHDPAYPNRSSCYLFIFQASRPPKRQEPHKHVTHQERGASRSSTASTTLSLPHAPETVQAIRNTQPIAMQRARNPRSKGNGVRQSGRHHGADSGIDLRSTIATIDAETRPILPEEAWFGPEFQARAVPWEQGYAQADIYNTGAFTVCGPISQHIPEESSPYATDASRLNSHIVQNEKRQSEAIRKFDQLVRHGLVVGDYDHPRPLLAMPEVSRIEQERRERTAQKLVDHYIYESPEDEPETPDLLKDSRKKLGKNRLMKLKQALAKLEMPARRVQTNPYALSVSRDSETNTANASELTDGGGESRPTLGFQKAMRDSSHPDFGMSFTAALRLAMAKEKWAHILAVPEDFWETGDRASEQSTIVLAPPKRSTGVQLERETQSSLAKPQRRHHSINNTKVDAQRKYDIVEYTVAKASQTKGLDFRDMRLVDIFNGIMQRDNPRRPIRSQASLLDIARTDPVGYFGEDVMVLLDSDSLSTQVERAVARLLPASRLS